MMVGLAVSDEKSFEHRMAVKWAKTVSRVLQVGTVAAVLAIAARVSSSSGEAKIWEVEHIPLKAVWVAFFVLTVVHVFVGIFFVQAIENLRRSTQIDEQMAAYEDILVESGSYVSVSVRRLPRAGEHFVRMSLADSSTWVAHGGALAFLMAALPWWWHSGLHWPRWEGGKVGRWESSLMVSGIDVVLVIANWIVGGRWAIAVSELGTPLLRPSRDHASIKTLVKVAPTVVVSGAVGLVGLFSIVAAGGVFAWLVRMLIIQE